MNADQQPNLLNCSDLAGSIFRADQQSTNQIWSNLRKAALSLQGKPHEPFGTRNVEATARSVVRRIGRETGLDLVALELRLIAER